MKFRVSRLQIYIIERFFSPRQLFRARLIHRPGTMYRSFKSNPLLSLFLFFTLSFSLDETWPTVENFRAIFSLSLVCCINGEVVQILRLKRLVKLEKKRERNPRSKIEANDTSREYIYIIRNIAYGIFSNIISFSFLLKNLKRFQQSRVRNFSIEIAKRN